jgi:eukaryotic-like serine/threonine-protein kinase
VRALGELDPRHVGPYRVLAGLDGDEMGSVVLGSAPDGRLVAVKLVSGRLVADDGFPQRLAREAAAGRQAVAGSGPAGSWVATEFVPGISMRQLVECGVLLGEDAVLRLAAGLVDAVAATHRAGLVHRDLTPVNVWLTGDGVRLFDFGVARAVDHDVSQVVASPEFMSPEQAGGQAVTPASDVFSLGVVLYLAATGRSPFAGGTRAETSTLVMRAQPELSASLPARVRALLAACLVKEPHRRATVEQLRALIGPAPHPWPPVVHALIAEEQAAVARLVGSPDQTTRIAPVVVPAAPPPPRRRGEDERWKPDMWAVVSGAAVVVAIVFAIVMFNALTPDRPLRASGQESSAVPTTTTTEETTTTTTTTTQEQPFGEVTGLAGKCVDVAGARTDNGTPVQLQECNGTDAQQWEFTPDGTMEALGKCLDVSGGATDDGTTVQLYDCNGTKAQQWVLTTDGWILNVGSNKCLDVPRSETADGTQLIIWTCHGEENQVWAPPA